jgi:hypothetical protein
MKRYTIAVLRKLDRIMVLDNTPGSSVRAYYHEAVQLDGLSEVIPGSTNQEWLAQVSGTNSIVCELDDYRDLPKLHPELLV